MKTLLPWKARNENAQLHNKYHCKAISKPELAKITPVNPLNGK